MSSEPKPGSILTNTTIGIMDTIVALVRGKIRSNVDTLAGASVLFLNTESRRTFGTLTNMEGAYRIYLIRGKYDMTIQCIGYQPFVIKNVVLRSGQIQAIDVKLGETGGYTTYAIQSKKPLTPRQIKRLIQKNRKKQ
jgi:Carboxypeptidase regulatory-like domain